MIPIVLLGIAVGCSFISNFYCDSIQYQVMDDQDASLQDPISLGPWYWMQTETSTSNNGNYVVVKQVCTALPSETPIGAQWKTVRACTILASLLGGSIWVAIAFNNCTHFLSPSRFRSLGILVVLVCTILQGLTFLIFPSNACSDNPVQWQSPAENDDTENTNSNGTVDWETLFQDNCTWSSGSDANAVSVLFYLIAGGVMLWRGAPQPPPRDTPAETQTVTYTQMVHADGTTTIAEETQVVKGTAATLPVTTGLAQVEEAAVASVDSTEKV